MVSSTFTPVIVGVGEFKNRSSKTEDAIEPAELMLRAIHCAIDDSGVSLSSDSSTSTYPRGTISASRIGVDSIHVVQT